MRVSVRDPSHQGPWVHQDTHQLETEPKVSPNLLKIIIQIFGLSQLLVVTGCMDILQGTVQLPLSLPFLVLSHNIPRGEALHDDTKNDCKGD